MKNMECKLKKKAWLYRLFEVVTPEGQFKVEYNGRGMGFERVLVGDEVADSKQTVYWFAPKFEFLIGSLPAVLEVRVWIWLQIKSVKLTVAGQVLHAE